MSLIGLGVGRGLTVVRDGSAAEGRRGLCLRLVGGLMVGLPL